MILVDVADIKKSKSNMVYGDTVVGNKFWIPDKCLRPWEGKPHSILKNVIKIYCFWINEANIYIRDGDHEKASILTTHGKLFRKKNDILDILKNNELKSIYGKGYVNAMVARDINQTSTSALYITRGDSNNEISDASLTTIKSLADKLNYRVYKYIDPSGVDIIKSINDNGGYTKNGSFINYADSGDLNQVAIYEPT